MNRHHRRGTDRRRAACPPLPENGTGLAEQVMLVRNRDYVRGHLEDMPEDRDRTWAS